MWLRNWLLSFLMMSWVLGSTTVAQQPIRWQWSLEGAKQIAGRTNRLVLVHFWSDRCPPCRRMEQEVFNRPEVAAALEADYVPVKLHFDHFPSTARQYGISAIPADVVLTPQGEVIEKYQGYAEAGQYVGRLNQVAAAYRARSGAMYAQIAPRPNMAGLPPLERDAPMQEASRFSPSMGSGLSAPQGLADQRRVESFQGPPQVAAMTPNPSYSGRVAVNPTQPQPAISNGPPTMSSMPNLSGPSWPSAPAGAAVAESPLPSPAPALSPPLSPQPAVAVPPGNPPLALDGYCPVQLTEKERWVRGNPQWGVRHEGRTYLFAGPEEQRRFYAEPERFAPVLAGDDVVLLVEQGKRVTGRREHGAWFQDRVYLFTTEANLQKFSVDPHRFAAVAAKPNASVAGRPEMRLPPAQPGQAGPWGSPGGVPGGVPMQYR